MDNITRSSHTEFFLVAHNGMMSMMMRSLVSEPLGGVVSGAIFGACPGSKGTDSA